MRLTSEGDMFRGNGQQTLNYCLQVVHSQCSVEPVEHTLVALSMTRVASYGTPHYSWQPESPCRSFADQVGLPSEHPRCNATPALRDHLAGSQSWYLSGLDLASGEGQTP